MDNLTWDDRYRARRGEPFQEPSEFLLQALPLLPRGRALDAACGQGRDSILLAENGFMVDALDSSREALIYLSDEARSRSLRIKTIKAGMSEWLIGKKEIYNLVICFNFLLREALPLMESALCRGGRLVVETFTIDQARFNLYRGPRHKKYLLEAGELPGLFPNCIPIIHREGIFKRKKYYMSKACLLAVKR